MAQIALQEKIVNLQAQLNLIKKALLQKVDFVRDERAWGGIQSTVKKVRGKVYQRRYGKT